MEVEALKRRIDDVEKQNRALLQMLTDLRVQKDGSGQPEASNVQISRDSRNPRVIPASDESPPETKKAEEPVVRWSELLGEGNRIKFYGFLRLDMLFDSQRPNNPQAILFITSPDPKAGNTDKGDFTMHPRLTRFGIDYTGPSIGRLGDAKLSGKLEVDFQNGGSESRQVMRVRHGFLKLDWKNFRFLPGRRGTQCRRSSQPLTMTRSNGTQATLVIDARNCAWPTSRRLAKTRSYP